jgi:hypothetical protein
LCTWFSRPTLIISFVNLTNRRCEWSVADGRLSVFVDEPHAGFSNSVSSSLHALDLNSSYYTISYTWWSLLLLFTPKSRRFPIYWAWFLQKPLSSLKYCLSLYECRIDLWSRLQENILHCRLHICGFYPMWVFKIFCWLLVLLDASHHLCKHIWIIQFLQPSGAYDGFRADQHTARVDTFPNFILLTNNTEMHTRDSRDMQVYALHKFLEGGMFLF